MNTLVLTVGLPQSGKSTWARTQDCPIVNPDSIRLAIHGKAFIGSAEPYVWAIAKTMVASLFLAGHDRVILDATNTTWKRRNEWRSAGWKREFKCFDTPANVCIERAEETADPENLAGLLQAIQRMDENFEPVSETEQSQ